MSFIDSAAFTWIILPLLIFLARVIDVGMGTVRTIFMVRGYKTIVPIIAFFEVSVWLLAVRQVITNLPNPATFIGYAAGFAMGNLVGMVIEEKLSLGHVLIRIITQHDATGLLESLKQQEYTVTTMGAQGKNGNVRLINVVIKRKNIKKVAKLVRDQEPDAFYTVEDVRMGHMHPHKKQYFSRFWRAGK
ncbi:MAG: DUF2179 domain-containing protein [Candidatus Woesearchaeota archaeon]